MLGYKTSLRFPCRPVVTTLHSIYVTLRNKISLRFGRHFREIRKTLRQRHIERGNFFLAYFFRFTIVIFNATAFL